MNFLSHYYFDRSNPDPYQVMGGVLPDLVRNAKKDWTFRPEKRPLNNPVPELVAILSGWRQHLHIDRIFHCSGFFNHHTALIRTAIAPVLDRSPVRPSFLAHISLELMLDSLLQTEGIVDADHFYSQLSKCSHAVLEQFLILNNADNPAAFFPFLDEFIHSRYIHTYRDPLQVVYALNRICMRVWDDPFTETQKMQLAGFLPDYQERLKPVFMEIFYEIAGQLD